MVAVCAKPATIPSGTAETLTGVPHPLRTRSRGPHGRRAPTPPAAAGDTSPNSSWRCDAGQQPEALLGYEPHTQLILANDARGNVRAGGARNPTVARPEAMKLAPVKGRAPDYGSSRAPDLPARDVSLGLLPRAHLRERRATPVLRGDFCVPGAERKLFLPGSRRTSPRPEPAVGSG